MSWWRLECLPHWPVPARLPQVSPRLPDTVDGRGTRPLGRSEKTHSQGPELPLSSSTRTKQAHITFHSLSIRPQQHRAMPRHFLRRSITGVICVVLAIILLLMQQHVITNPFGSFADVLRNKLERRLVRQRLEAFFGHSLEQRRRVYDNYTGDEYVYRAPLHHCGDSAPRDVEGEYTVYLHRGYGLEQHKHALRGHVDLDQSISDVFRPSGGLWELNYEAHLNETSLAAVRADLGVDLVECPSMGYLIEGIESKEQLSDEELNRMVEYADCLFRRDEIEAGADASEDEIKAVEQLCGPIRTWEERNAWLRCLRPEGFRPEGCDGFPR